MTESGRALAAHHAILVAEVVGTSTFEGTHDPLPVTKDSHEVVRELAALAETVTVENAQECYHDAMTRARRPACSSRPASSTSGRGQMEEQYWWVIRAIVAATREMEFVPEGMQGLEQAMADTFFVNMSVFQSMPDLWAIGQVFPVMPLQRLDEEPMGVPSSRT